MLDIKQVLQLKSEIRLGSLFTHDYENSLNISPIVVQEFFDGYIDYLQELQEEDEEFGVQQDLDYYNTEENLESWFNCFEDDPLPYDKTYHYMRENRIPYSDSNYKTLKNREVDLEI